MIRLLTIIDILFILFSFVNVYFLVMFFIVFAKERKNINSLPELKNLPFVSIIIPAYNKEKFIAGTIKAVKDMAYPKNLLEIIVIDDGSTDGTYDSAKKAGGIRLFRKANGGRSDALNYGIERAKGEIIACVDADSYPAKDSLARAVRFFDDEKVAGVTVSVLVKNADRLIQKLQKIEYALLVLSRKLMETLNCIYVTPGPMALYRRDVIRKVGGFDRENMTEDIEIAWRLLKHGYKIKMCIDSKVYTDVPETVRSWWHQRIRWNVGGAQTVSKYFDCFLKRPSNIGMFLLPLFTLSFLITFLGLAMFSYIVSTVLYNLVFVHMKSALLGADILKFSFSLTPDILFVVGIFTFVASIVWLKISTNALKGEISIRKNFLEFAVFILFYMALSPFNLIEAMWRLMRKSYEW